MDPKSLVKDAVGEAKRLVARAVKLTYATERTNRLRVLRRATQRDPGAWVVFQMGKVGSTTVADSLEALGDRPHVYHTHFLTPTGIAWAEEQYRSNYARTRALPLHVIDSILLRERLDAGATLGWRVVTLLRDPVARNLSSFFQTMYLDRPDVDITDTSDAAVARLHQRFLDAFDHDFPLRWLDEELGASLGVDPYSATDTGSGGAFILEARGSRPGLLVLKLERLVADGPAALGGFLDRPEVPLLDANAAESKDYGALYHRFMDTLELPSSYLDRMYESKMARHFYDAEELAGFRSRWTS
ncbi:MAG: putative capsular polysaccharide synthesis family protein [Actinomycetota bacterium]|nr:putative capsular polysaccharide synthesis family protein [Actinomycetota bacterium]